MVQCKPALILLEVAVADLWMLKLSKKVRTVVFRNTKGKLMALISTDTSLTAAPWV